MRLLLRTTHGTLHEAWDDGSSLNHIMFGDLSAWAYKFAAGIVPLEPGFRKIAFRPHVLQGVDSFLATHKTRRSRSRNSPLLRRQGLKAAYPKKLHNNHNRKNCIYGCF